MAVVLHQFQASHFNEKARWALTYKNVAHERVSYLPGPHMPAIKKLSGQSQTPLLQIDETYTSGSAAIIDLLERSYPDQSLYPADDEARAAALDLQQRFDASVGPAVRTVVFSVLVRHPGYLCKIFACSHSALKQLAYRAIVPALTPVIGKANGVTPENTDKAFSITAAALDEVAQLTAETGYTVGATFSVADLTAAALLAPIAALTHPDMARPQPMPADFAELIARYAEHDAIAWVQRMYAQHRS